MSTRTLASLSSWVRVEERVSVIVRVRVRMRVRVRVSVSVRVRVRVRVRHLRELEQPHHAQDLDDLHLAREDALPREEIEVEIEVKTAAALGVQK
jgi:hypothetical protein